MVLPLWPPEAKSMIVEEDGVYELRAVPTTSISLVTDCVIKVRASAIDAPLIYICFLRRSTLMKSLNGIANRR